ncbi:PALP-domain-containing protein [Piedraia hortae CBS 480.64]|uniref:Cysteine synthase 2 n=1 Tax=Piedraia hortae CBS 480.64 TaxID=1314780 RepID=A0A6A7C8B9_9PEZI|nr:PALP-domain-containing protein [Piedraia hortae CBS 480.64]
MGLFSDIFTSMWNRILDNKGKITSTGGFLLGVLLTLAFKDLYPDLEHSFRKRLNYHQHIDSTLLSPARGVQLEDHENDSQPPDEVSPPSHGIEDLIGNTPLIKLPSLSSATGCEIFAKCEHLNGAGNSPKDRVALSMLVHAEESGLIAPNRGDTIYEGTVGSTGISLAAVCRSRGYKAYICMPNDQSLEKSDLLLKLGAAVERVKPASIVDQEQFVNLARRRAEEHTSDPEKPGRGFFADQFENPANYLAHQRTTGPEIFKQMGGRLDAFVAGAGTGGTISGCALALKPVLPGLRVVLADPQGSGLYNKVKYGVMFSNTEAEGTRRRHQVDSVVEGIGVNRLTKNFKVGMHLIDDAVKVTDQQAMMMARWLVEKEGLFVGASSAVNCVAAARIAREMGRGGKKARIVTVLCDSGTRHLSKFWMEVGDIGGEGDGLELDDILGRE